MVFVLAWGLGVAGALNEEWKKFVQEGTMYTEKKRPEEIKSDPRGKRLAKFLDPFGHNATLPNDESREQHVPPKKNHSNATNNILESL
jgi:hypothetical protein|eukprot:scaffold6361_cov193-Alexandrium_tamarense.AAC.2